MVVVVELVKYMMVMVVTAELILMVTNFMWRYTVTVLGSKYPSMMASPSSPPG